MDENNEGLEDNIVTLKDEDGNDVNFEFLDLIEYEGEEYIVLLPAEDVENEEPDEVVILKTEKAEEGEEDSDSDEETYVSVEDEDVLNAVFDIFKDKFKDEFNFVD